MECADKLEEVGIRVTAEFGPAAEIFIQWADEGFPGDFEEEISELENRISQDKGFHRNIHLAQSKY